MYCSMRVARTKYTKAAENSWGEERGGGGEGEMISSKDVAAAQKGVSGAQTLEQSVPGVLGRAEHMALAVGQSFM